MFAVLANGIASDLTEQMHMLDLRNAGQNALDPFSHDAAMKTLAFVPLREVPLGEIPRIDTPFKRVAIDIVGPIHPVTDR
ncbi:hypothetical protein DPMN_179249 [Dreissena polymorpha]|uniref:Uncharacterized protein n=1 Tax=Dreissena polymorpha TaxID=45954 RepID=A0A9D4IJE5_DREPO|nr:hypothetical protein DPMN_179249 [Dreissena polymorpha]